MAEGANEAAGQVAAALAYVCGHLDPIRADLHDDGAGDVSPLQRLLQAVGDGQDITGPIEDLHTALLAVGDALGVYGHARGLRPVGLDATAEGETLYLCPASRCSRYSWPEAAGLPRCEITGQDLRRERL